MEKCTLGTWLMAAQQQPECMIMWKVHTSVKVTDTETQWEVVVVKPEEYSLLSTAQSGQCQVSQDTSLMLPTQIACVEHMCSIVRQGQDSTTGPRMDVLKTGKTIYFG